MVVAAVIAISPVAAEGDAPDPLDTGAQVDTVQVCGTQTIVKRVEVPKTFSYSGSKLLNNEPNLVSDNPNGVNDVINKFNQWDEQTKEQIKQDFINRGYDDVTVSEMENKNAKFMGQASDDYGAQEYLAVAEPETASLQKERAEAVANKFKEVAESQGIDIENFETSGRENVLTQEQVAELDSMAKAAGYRDAAEAISHVNRGGKIDGKLGKQIGALITDQRGVDVLIDGKYKIKLETYNEICKIVDQGQGGGGELPFEPIWTAAGGGEDGYIPKKLVIPEPKAPGRGEPKDDDPGRSVSRERKRGVAYVRRNVRTNLNNGTRRFGYNREGYQGH